MIKTSPRRSFSFGLIASVLSASAHSLPEVPVFLKESVAPNILLTLDDSGSMAWGYVPDNLSGSTGTTRFLAASFNRIQYNPTTKYIAPPKSDGTRYATSFTAAWHDGFLRVNNTPLNLSSSYRPTSSYTAGNTGGTLIGTAQAAYYYVYDASIGTCVTPNRNSDTCYRKVVVSASSGPGATDERQNFANWYSFYRTRHLLMKSSLLVALGDVDPQLRFAWQSLNSCQGGWGGTSCTDVLNNSYANAMAPLITTHRTRLFNWVAGVRSSGGTPLQNAFVRAGDYFRDTTANNPYRDVPGNSASPANACRLSYHVALTDGIWNSGAAAVGNSDGTGGTLPDGKTYTAMAPYAGASSNNIADLAFSHWREDLQTGLSNTAPSYSITGNNTPPTDWPAAEYWNPQNNPATWQSLVTYTIGLGLTGSLTNPVWQGSTYASDVAGNGYQQFASGAVAWPNTGADVNPGNVYDLWHAAINGRGQFYSAESPEDVYEAFQSILARITARSGSAGNVATAGAYVFSNSLAYQSSYTSNSWQGTVSARRVGLDGLVGVLAWSTDTSMAGLNYTARNLYTRQLKTVANPNPPAIPFAWASMDAATRVVVKNEDTSKWLRGDQSLEQNNPSCSVGCIYRNRTKLLGDILGSSAVVSSDQDFGYKAATWTGGGNPYRLYLATKIARTPVVLVGSNDGFVHGFNANDGTELFGYAPGAVIDKMWRLSEPVYVKKAFVDGPITVGDAYISGSWGTYAVGALGAGGKSVYALNITNPTSFSASSVAWEFTHPDMGYLMSKPVISRLPDGTWAAIFSGGYENSTNSAILFTVNLQNGALIAALPLTKTTDACGTTPVATVKNGLGAPRAFSGKDGEFYIYAGDLWGHMWRFEYSTALGRMITSFSGSPLFKACNANSVRQAITAPPSVTAFGASPFVYFGTGRLFDTGDTSLATVNSFYGVIDDNVAHTASRSSLLGQQTVSALGTTNRRVSTNPVNLVQKRGWFFDLPTTGERVVANPTLLDERVAFNTLIPASEACESKGTSWLFEVDALGGGTLPSPVLDLNNDGQFTTADLVGGIVPAARAIEATVSGITAIRTPDAPREGANASAGTANRCAGGNIKLLTSNVYTPGFAENCTPGATFRTGWRQLR